MAKEVSSESVIVTFIPWYVPGSMQNYQLSDEELAKFMAPVDELNKGISL